MVRLHISPEESQILINALQSYLSELRMEIADTDRYEFKRNLKLQKALLIRVVDALARQQKIPAS